MLRNVSSLLFSIEGIKRALRSIFHIAQHMGVNHGRLDILVPEKALNLSDIDAVHQEMRRKAVAIMPSSA